MARASHITEYDPGIHLRKHIITAMHRKLIGLLPLRTIFSWKNEK
jgi:hypothetical protein